MTDLEALVVAAYVFADEYPVPPRGGRRPLVSAEAEGVLCYLETPFPRTHAFYRRLGFEIASESNPFAGAPPLWTMIRRPVVIRR